MTGLVTKMQGTIRKIHKIQVVAQNFSNRD
jgi:hypothetical protein